MKNLKRLIAGILTAGMVAGLAACGEGTAEETTTEAAGEETTQGEGAEVDSRYPNPDEPVTLTLFADYTWLEFDQLGGIVPEEIKRQTGVDIDFMKATDSEQLVLMLSGTDLPDLVSTGSSSKLGMLSDPDISYSYNELIEQYAPDWEVPEVEQKSNAHFSQDGNFYFLRNYFNTLDELTESKNVGDNYGQFHMRKDIYDALGAPEMHTEDDLFALLNQVKTEYPDMIPMVMNTGEYTAFGSLVGYDAGFPSDSEGNFVFPLSDPTYKEFMRVINRTYREGLMTAENFSFADNEQVNQFIASGQAFMTTFYAGNDEQTFTALVQASVPEASFVQVPLFDNWKNTFDVSGWAGVAITRDCSNPEAAIKLIRWAKDNKLTSMLGIEGTDWTLNEDGTVNNGERMTQALEDGNVETLYNPMTFILSSSDYIIETQARFYSSATPETRVIMDDAHSRAQYTNAVGLSYPASGSDEDVVETKLYDLMDEYLPVLGMAESDEAFESLYTEMMGIADDIGLAGASEWRTSTYKAVSEDMGTK